MFKGGPYSLSANKEPNDVNKINRLFVEIVENIILTQGSEPRPSYSSTIATDTITTTNHHEPTSSPTTTAQEK